MASIAVLLSAASVLTPEAKAQSITYTYTYDGPPLFIFHNSANIITVANIYVPRAITVTNVTANVEIDYPNPGDLNVFMYSPLLTRTILLERNCGNRGTLVNITFDDSAPTPYSSVCPATPGTYRGNQPLANFDNQLALGTWSLAVENNGSDVLSGYVRGFTITITGTPATTMPITGPNAVFNAAGLQSAVVAPGEVIDIEGVNLGPSPAVFAPSGDLPTTLGGVQVTFDGTPAALSYVSPYVLNAQVPFSVRAGGQTKMVISYQGNSSNSVTLDVAATVPGVYTQSANGTGTATAVNQDGTMNSLSNPATRGQFITVYASGLGTLNPALSTGQTPPSSPLSSTTSVATALVGGVGASVSFAGAAPGFPGLYQINLQIPTTTGSGVQSLALFAAGSSSQFGVNIFVH